MELLSFHRIMLIWYLIIFSGALYKGYASKLDTVYVSPNGQDKPSCGTINDKCKTVNKAILKVADNATIILDSAPETVITYPVHVFPLRISMETNLIFRKISSRHRNPLIVGSKSPPSPTLFSNSSSYNITVDSVDMENITLLNISNAGYIYVKIDNASIRSHQGFPFIAIKDTRETNVVLRNCNLNSKNDFGVRKTVWLSHISSDVRVKSSVTIIRSNITGGGSFRLEGLGNVSFKYIEMKEIKEQFQFLSIKNSHMEITRCSFSNNWSTSTDGFIYVVDSKVDIIASKFEENSLHTLLKCIRSDISLIGTTISGTTASNTPASSTTVSEMRSGGGPTRDILHGYDHSNLIVKACSLMLNKAENIMKTRYSSGISMEQSTVLNNNARIILSLSGDTNISSSTFRDNIVSSIVHSDNEINIELTNVRLENNKVSRSLINVAQVKLTIKQSSIARNEVTHHLIRLHTARAAIKNVTIKNNICKTCITGMESTVAELSHTNFEGNVATGFSKLAYFFDSYLYLRNVKSRFNKSSRHLENENPIISSYKSVLDMENVTLKIMPSFTSSSIPVLQWILNREYMAFKPSIHVQCSNYYNPNSRSVPLSTKVLQYQLFCKSCEKGKYTLKGGFETVTTIVEGVRNVDSAPGGADAPRIDGFNSRRHSTSCKQCPPGGDCDKGIIQSRDHFYGFYTVNDTVEFLPCPTDYCCTKKKEPCTSITSCNQHRTGRLCGKCKNGYYINYFGNDCVLSSNCTKHQQMLFWFVNLLNIVMVTLVLIFSKSLKSLLKTFFSKLKSNIAARLRKLRPKKAPRMIGNFELESSAPTQRNSRITNTTNSFNEDQTFTFSGVFSILVSFYQLKALLTIYDEKETNLFIDSILNVEIVTKKAASMCPTNTLSVIQKQVLKNWVTPLLMLFIAVSILGISIVIGSIKKRRFIGGSPCFGNFYAGIYIIVAFSYKNICKLALTLFHCRTMGKITFLYISGDIVCYNEWQTANIVFFASWVVPFPLAVVLGYRLFKRKQIRLWMFMLCLVVPIVAPFVFVYQQKGEREPTLTCLNSLSQNVKMRLEEIFEEPYKEKFAWWECWRLYERFIVTAISVFLINPVQKIFYMTPVMVFFLYLHSTLKPHKETMSTLQRLDMVSYYCLFVQLVINAFRSVVHVYVLSEHNLIGNVLSVAGYFEHIFSPLWYLILTLVVRKVYKKVKRQ